MRKIEYRVDSKGTKDKIIALFFESHLRPVDISERLKVSKSYITKTIQKDSRYIEEKETRKAESKEKNKIQKRICARNRREKERQEYQALLEVINRDNVSLSAKRKISNLQYAKWNRSVYEYDKTTSDLVLRNGVNAGYSVAKRVRNVVNPDAIRGSNIYV